MVNSGREWDWIQELYYKELKDKSKSNRDSRKDVSSKKKISGTQDKPRKRKHSRS